jgi:hypothetical protein
MLAITQIVISVLSSRIAQLVLVSILAFGWGSIRTDQSWKIKIAKQNDAAEAAYNLELERQKAAGAQIMLDAEKRKNEDALIISDMQKIIDEAAANEPKTSQLSPCRIDSDFARIVQRIDATSHRKAKSPRRSRRFR